MQRAMRWRLRRPRTGVDVVPVVLFIDCMALGVAALVAPLTLRSAVLMLVLIVCFNAAGGHYRPRLAPSLLDEIPGLVARALVAGAIVTALRVLIDLPVQQRPVTGAVVFIVLACLGRAVGYPMMRRNRLRGRVARPTIIVGCGRVGHQLARTLLEHPEYGLKPVGFVDDSPFIPTTDLPVKLLGGTSSLTDLLLEHRVTNVIVAFSSSRESIIVDVLRTCDRLACEIFLVPRFFELHAGARDNELVWGLPLVRLRRAPYRTLTWRLKRCADAALALLGLLRWRRFSSPVLWPCGSRVAPASSSGRNASGWTAAPSPCSSSVRSGRPTRWSRPSSGPSEATRIGRVGTISPEHLARRAPAAVERPAR